jgi:esterase
MNLHFRAVGEGPSLIILHGLLGSGDNWRSMSLRLATHYRVFTVDLRNHGQSPHSDLFDYDAMATDLRQFVDDQALPAVVLLGHSMGGKVAMQFAVDNSARVDKLVIVDIAPKPSDPAHRYLLEALRSLDLQRYKSFVDVDAALAAKVSDQAVRQFALKNLARDQQGRLSWRIHLEAIYRNYDKLGRGLAPGRRFDKPTLFIRGGRSRYIEDDDAPLIRQIFPQTEIVTLARAGHWVHIDVPDDFYRTVVSFVSRA